MTFTHTLLRRKDSCSPLPLFFQAKKHVWRGNVTCSRSPAAGGRGGAHLRPSVSTSSFLPANLCDKRSHTLQRAGGPGEGGGDGSWHQTQGPSGSLFGRAGQNLGQARGPPRGVTPFPAPTLGSRCSGCCWLVSHSEVRQERLLSYTPGMRPARQAGGPIPGSPTATSDLAPAQLLL